ncbi:MAG: DUF4926 domain-containing protein [Calditrichaeota bacterium]|nr:MAG: DUF4926 domain-containing protein [Calditrichota bacterium]
MFYQNSKGKKMIRIHDFIAVLIDIKNTVITRGTTGTIVSRLDDAYYLVEFSDNNGQVYEQIPIHQANLLVLHQITEKADAI